MESEELPFPKGFLWGAATSAHQVEGNNQNDWSEWEQSGARIKSGRACDHYNRFHEDFDIAQSLNHNAHRFSIEWSRIESEEGVWNEKELAHYREVIGALRERGMEPFVTLWHLTLPVWFARQGGWLGPNAQEKFLRFVQKVVMEYGKDVRYWITLNEPETFARHGYVAGNRPPAQHLRIMRALKVMNRLVKAHRAAYDLIHRISPNAQVGFAESVVHFDLYNRWPHNIVLLRFLELFRNNLFVPRVAEYCDFIGLNYYFHSRVRLNPFKSTWGIQHNENKRVSDFGWEIYPQGIYHVLKDLKKYQKPIYITENGVADSRDIHREAFIKEHLVWIHKAIREGIDARGYFYWSLLDNFEWNKGFWPRFGLVEVDYKTMKRTIRHSAESYARIAAENGIAALTAAMPGKQS